MPEIVYITLCFYRSAFNHSGFDGDGDGGGDGDGDDDGGGVGSVSKRGQCGARALSSW